MIDRQTQKYFPTLQFETGPGFFCQLCFAQKSNPFTNVKKKIYLLCTMNHFYKNFILVTSNNPSHAFVLMRNNSCMISNFVNMCCWIIPWSHLWIAVLRENYNTRFTYSKTIWSKSKMMVIITILIHIIYFIVSIFPILKKFRFTCDFDDPCYCLCYHLYLHSHCLWCFHSPIYLR